ncbi:MAG: hypothetical protein ACW99A_21805, partial [Candidatus Kariarchaeaceae archaeon]
FVIEDENLSIIYTFADADVTDLDSSYLNWYVNGVHQPQYDNLTIIPLSETVVGQLWSVQIIPYDGEDTGLPIISLNKTIEDRPEIINFGFYPTNQTEGEYVFWLEIESNPENPISSTAKPTIGFDIDIGDSFNDFTTANFNGTSNFYEVIWKYSNYSPELLGSFVNISVTVTSNVRYNNIPSLISTDTTFNFVIMDTAPPRVKNVNVQYRDEELIENITFKVEIEEFGSGVQNVTIFYAFEPTTLQTETSNPAYFSSSNRFRLQQSNQLPLGFKTVQLSQINSSASSISFWSATVDFNVNSSVLILYQIQVADNSGNINPDAWSPGLDRSNPEKYTLPSEGIPLEEVLTYVAAIMVIMVIFSFIVIKKFRSKELVGLDIDVVMENIQKMKLKDEDVKNSLDSHTLGIVISFFDQRHGPIPVMQEPPILRDNFELLIELSDLSFSAVRFVDNFEEEIQAIFDFNVGERTQVSSISYAFSLNRPNARGGAENITLNILVLKDIFPLMSQFISQFSEIIKNIHEILDSDPESKDKVQEEIVKLRYLISKIVLSYLEIYGTTELIMEDNN